MSEDRHNFSVIFEFISVVFKIGQAILAHEFKILMFFGHFDQIGCFSFSYSPKT